MATDPKRRRWLVGGVAAAAAAAGGGFAWWRAQAGATGPVAADPLWSQEFQTPAGGVLSLASLRGKPLLVNFWATWCPPCVEELPLLDAFYRQNSAIGWQVVGLAIDQPSAVRKFLERTPVSFPIGLAGLGGTELVRALGNGAGGLPFSLVVAANGSIRQRRMGQLTAELLKSWKAEGES